MSKDARIKKGLILTGIIIALLVIILLVITFASAESAELPTDYDDLNLADYVTLCDYEDLTYSVEDVYITSSDIQDEIDTLIATYTTEEEVDSGTVEDDSVINIDYVGTIDGEEFDGGSAEGEELDISDSTYIDGFAEAIIGHEVGETFDIEVTFPDSYGDEDLAGQDAVFTITINYIIETVVPDYDDDFVSTYTDYDTTDEYESAIYEELYASALETAESDAQEELFNSIVEASVFSDLPSSVVSSKVDDYIDLYTSLAESYDYTYDSYVTDILGLTVDDFEALIESYAEELVEQELVLWAIAEKEEISLTDDGYDDYLVGLLEDAGYTKSSYEEAAGMSIYEYAEQAALYDQYIYTEVMSVLVEICAE